MIDKYLSFIIFFSFCQVTHNRKVTFDQATGTFTGLPKEWKKKLAEKKDKGKKPAVAISSPFNVQHKMHVKKDPHSSTGFSGLPPHWKTLLECSGITKEEVNNHADEVLDVLKFHMGGGPPPKKLPPSHMTLAKGIFFVLKCLHLFLPSIFHSQYSCIFYLRYCKSHAVLAA